MVNRQDFVVPIFPSSYQICLCGEACGHACALHVPCIGPGNCTTAGLPQHNCQHLQACQVRRLCMLHSFKHKKRYHSISNSISSIYAVLLSSKTSKVTDCTKVEVQRCSAENTGCSPITESQQNIVQTGKGTHPCKEYSYQKASVA